MQTDTEFAAYCENNMWVAGDGDRPDTYIYMVDDQEDVLVFDLVDEDGEHYSLPVAPFDHVTIITSFEDDE